MHILITKFVKYLIIDEEYKYGTNEKWRQTNNGEMLKTRIINLISKLNL